MNIEFKIIKNRKNEYRLLYSLYDYEPEPHYQTWLDTGYNFTSNDESPLTFSTFGSDSHNLIK